MHYVISILKKQLEYNKERMQQFNGLSNTREQTPAVKEAYEATVNWLFKSNQEIKQAIKILKENK